MADSARYFFRASKNSHSQLTRLFVFMHPAVIAMWNLRWQVNGFLSVCPQATQKDLSSRFSVGLDVSSGSLRRISVDDQWDDQIEQFASIILTSAIAIFEDFTAQITNIINTTERSKRDLSTALQFPSYTDNNGQRKGRQLVIDKLGGPSLFVNNIAWDKKILNKYNNNSISDLMACYRFFKEIRNSISHNGKRANSTTVLSCNKFESAINNGKIGGTQVPEYTKVSNVGDEVKITYRGVVGFTDIILRIITYIDIEFSGYKIAETEVIQRIPDFIDASQVFPKGRQETARRIRKILNERGFSSINLNRDIADFLAQNKKIPYYAAQVI